MRPLAPMTVIFIGLLHLFVQQHYFALVGEAAISLWRSVSSPSTQMSLHRHENRSVLVLQQHNDELCGFRLARIAADQVNVGRTFVKRLAG